MNRVVIGDVDLLVADKRLRNPQERVGGTYLMGADV